MDRKTAIGVHRQRAKGRVGVTLRGGAAVEGFIGEEDASDASSGARMRSSKRKRELQEPAGSSKRVRDYAKEHGGKAVSGLQGYTSHPVKEHVGPRCADEDAAQGAAGMGRLQGRGNVSSAAISAAAPLRGSKGERGESQEAALRRAAGGSSGTAEARPAPRHALSAADDKGAELAALASPRRPRRSGSSSSPSSPTKGAGCTLQGRRKRRSTPTTTNTSPTRA